MCVHVGRYKGLLTKGECFVSIGVRIADFTGEIVLTWNQSLFHHRLLSPTTLISVEESQTWYDFFPWRKRSLPSKKRGDRMGHSPWRSSCMDLCNVPERLQLPCCECPPSDLTLSFSSFARFFTISIRLSFSSLQIPLNSFNKTQVSHPSRVSVSRPTPVFSFTPATPSQAPFVLVIYRLT